MREPAAEARREIADARAAGARRARIEVWHMLCLRRRCSWALGARTRAGRGDRDGGRRHWMLLVRWWWRLDDDRWFVDGRLLLGRAVLVRREELAALARFLAGLRRTAAGCAAGCRRRGVCLAAALLLQEARQLRRWVQRGRPVRPTTRHLEKKNLRGDRISWMERSGATYAGISNAETLILRGKRISMRLLLPSSLAAPSIYYSSDPAPAPRLSYPDPEVKGTYLARARLRVYRNVSSHVVSCGARPAVREQSECPLAMAADRERRRAGERRARRRERWW